MGTNWYSGLEWLKLRFVPITKLSTTSFSPLVRSRWGWYHQCLEARPIGSHHFNGIPKNAEFEKNRSLVHHHLSLISNLIPSSMPSKALADPRFAPRLIQLYPSTTIHQNRIYTRYLIDAMPWRYALFKPHRKENIPTILRTSSPCMRCKAANL